MRLMGILALAMLLAGCTASGGGRDILGGYVDNGTLRVVRGFDSATGAEVVRVAGEAHAHATEGLAVDVALARGSCAKYGPQGDPEPGEALVTRVLPLADPATNTTVPFGTTLASPLPRGAELFVYARPHAENAIGPIFGLCENVPK